MDAEAVERTGELAERLEFDLTQELGYRYPDFSDRDEPAIAELTRVCNRAFEARYGGANGHKRKARARLGRGAGSDRRARARRVLPAALGGARARRRRRAGGARPRIATPLAAAGPRSGQLGRLARLLPDRALARRPRRGRPLARTVPQPRARLGARHRPRLPARHPREADRRAHRALRARARRARRELLDVPLARRDPRPRQGARAAVRRARAARARHRGQPEARRGGDRASFPTARTKLRSPRWRALAVLSKEIAGLPRHISQHPGGMVISSRPLDRARPGAARGHGGAPDLPVGQGLVRRRGLPEDRPARARHALGGRGLRRPDRRTCAARRSTCRGSRSTIRPSTRRSRTPTPSATSRSRAARRCRACSARARRTSTT